MVKARKKATVDILQQFDEVMMTRCARQPQEDVSRMQVATHECTPTTNLAMIPYLTSSLHSLSPTPPPEICPQGKERT